MTLGFQARRGTSFARRNSIEESLNLEHELMDIKPLQLKSVTWTDDATLFAGCATGEVRLNVSDAFDG